MEYSQMMKNQQLHKLTTLGHNKTFMYLHFEGVN
jgi:hypothetical protein